LEVNFSRAYFSGKATTRKEEFMRVTQFTCVASQNIIILRNEPQYIKISEVQQFYCKYIMTSRKLNNFIQIWFCTFFCE